MFMFIIYVLLHLWSIDGLFCVGSGLFHVMFENSLLRSLQDNAIIAVQGMTSAWEEAWSNL